MKRILKFLFATLLVFSLAACTAKPEEETNSKNLGTLTVGFVPSKEAEVILEAAEPMKEWLKAKLEEKGYTVDAVDLKVGSDFTAVGEGIAGDLFRQLRCFLYGVLARYLYFYFHSFRSFVSTQAYAWVFRSTSTTKQR